MRNFLHLSWIITLDNLKSNIDWHFVIVRISLVLYNFIKNRLTGKSNDLRLVLVNGRRLVLISSKITSSDAILPIHCLLKAWYAPFSQIRPTVDSLPLPALAPRTSGRYVSLLSLLSIGLHGFRISSVIIFIFIHRYVEAYIAFSAFLVLFARWNWLTVSFWAHKI